MALVDREGCSGDRARLRLGSWGSAGLWGSFLLCYFS